MGFALETGVPTNELKEKLMDLERYMPDESNLLYVFGSYLAEKLNPELTPLGFIVTAESVLYNLKKGFDDSSRIINNPLSKMPDELYKAISVRIKDIAITIMPVELTSEIKRIYSSLYDIVF